MGDPGSVVPRPDLAHLVLDHALDRDAIAFRIVLDGDLGRHASDRVDTAAVADLDQALGVGPQEEAVHRQAPAFGEDARRIARKLLDGTEDVIPAAAVGAGRVVSELVENLVDLEGREDRLDQDGRPNRADWKRKFRLRR